MDIDGGVKNDGTQPAAQRAPAGVSPEFGLTNAIDDPGAK
jgi:hypothetical protein